jgi:molybdenum cofactor guanylyltransferase
MRRLGAILAGGRSSRFGSDKAEFVVDGMVLLDHVATAMRPHVAQVAVIGRDWPGLVSIADYPATGLGPLGGVCGALRYAAAEGFDGVLLTGCDMLPLPFDAILGKDTAMVIEEQPLIGWWPVSFAAPLAEWLGSPGNRSVYKWIDTIGAERISLSVRVHNLNTREDVIHWIENQSPET